MPHTKQIKTVLLWGNTQREELSVSCRVCNRYYLSLGAVSLLAEHSHPSIHHGPSPTQGAGDGVTARPTGREKSHRQWQTILLPHHECSELWFLTCLYIFLTNTNVQSPLLGTYYFEELSSWYFLGFIHQLTPRSKELKNHYFIYPITRSDLWEGERGILFSLTPQGKRLGGPKP